MDPGFSRPCSSAARRCVRVLAADAFCIRRPEPHRVPPCHALHTFPTGCHNRTSFCCNIVAADNGATLIAWDDVHNLLLREGRGLQADVAILEGRSQVGAHTTLRLPDRPNSTCAKIGGLIYNVV